MSTFDHVAHEVDSVAETVAQNFREVVHGIGAESLSAVQEMRGAAEELPADFPAVTFEFDEIAPVEEPSAIGDEPTENYAPVPSGADDSDELGQMLARLGEHLSGLDSRMIPPDTLRQLQELLGKLSEPVARDAQPEVDTQPDLVELSSDERDGEVPAAEPVPVQEPLPEEPTASDESDNGFPAEAGGQPSDEVAPKRNDPFHVIELEKKLTDMLRSDLSNIGKIGNVFESLAPLPLPAYYYNTPYSFGEYFDIPLNMYVQWDSKTQQVVGRSTESRYDEAKKHWAGASSMMGAQAAALARALGVTGSK